jgi:heme exporter protein A
MLEATGLECVRGERTLFRDIAFTLGRGALLRVSGVNGSGKTSLLRIVCGLAQPAAGAVRWQGRNVRALREEYWKDLLYVGHANAVKDDLTAQENLHISCALGGLDLAPGEARDALEHFGIGGCARLPARVLSQGQRRRVALARLFLGATLALWVLDEPFTALDTGAVVQVQSLISAHLARGGTVILTTHQEVAIAAAVVQRIDLSA